MSEVGTTPPHNSDKPHGLVASINNNKPGFHIYTLHVDGQFDTYHVQSVVVKLNFTLRSLSED